MSSPASSSSVGTSSRRIVIERPSPELVAAIRANVELPPSNGNERWEVAGVRRIEADVLISRIVTHASDATTEQPIVWDD
ncbi:hypothetical protein EK0264_12680 [Epidermidibacterium keratini]|uniref:Uncharacterized protein n=1 Tax=Epidermidibacterium keratini TaxID=1891644 RepID=A0A7L4YPW5_9ACTN|nr:hypothetical protein [Epidermidibacterium keratini]QHC01062.1 hypothetical protein EK0264_12680 [Epidermidibacterium keratini]